MEKMVYSKEQLQRLSNAHQMLCISQNVDPQSKFGREVAALLLEKCSGDESEDVMIEKVSH